MRYEEKAPGRGVPQDLAELGIADGATVDIHREFKDNVDRVLRAFRVVSYPSARGCAAAYFPEANEPVPLGRQRQSS